MLPPFSRLMKNPIELIIGLGNPGSEYEKTRHNAGAWFVERLSQELQINLKFDKKFFGRYAKTTIHGHDCHLLIPTTFMNHSGQAVRAVSQFYKISPELMLIAYDDLDLPPGAIKLKFDGGHGGHNGLRDTINHIGSKQFHRLRIGIGHPGNAAKVVSYVLSQPKKSEAQKITQALDDAICVLDDILVGNLQKAMQALHTNMKK